MASFSPLLKILLPAALCLVLQSGLLPAAVDEGVPAPVVIRVTGYSPWACSPSTRARRSALDIFMRDMRDPETGKPWKEILEIRPENPLSFPDFSLKILSFAAGTGEEVVSTNEGSCNFSNTATSVSCSP